MKRREILAAGAVTLAWRPAAAQSYPGRPVTLLVGGAPGSVPDQLARPLAERLAASIGGTIVVENRPGAAGGIAMSALVRSAPDGHTLAVATMSQAVFNSYLFARLPYDPLRDLEPVAPLATGAMVLAAHPAFGGDTLADYVGAAKAAPGRLFMAVPQLGSPPHVVALFLNRAAGIDVRMVPHKSGNDALAAVLGGSVPLIMEAPTTIAPLVAAGRLRALAVTGPEREPLLPQVPTTSDGRWKVQAEAWIGLVAPKGTPPAVVKRLNDEVALICHSTDGRALLARLGFRPLAATAEEFGRLIREEHARWSPAIREAGLSLE
jgi:tripartite-type tricarboxylate transporter receptor subunit TctC